MKGGRLKIVNESSYPTDEVEALVSFGLDEIRLTGDGLVAVVKNTKRSQRRRRGQAAYSGTACSLKWGMPAALHKRYIGRSKAQHLIIMRIGDANCFPIDAFRHYPGVRKDVFLDWREALVCITAHEGMHVQHAYDGVYETKSGRRTITLPGGQRIQPDGSARAITRKRIVSVRVGTERIEPKCEAFEAYMLRRFRAEPPAAINNEEEVTTWKPKQRSTLITERSY